MDVGRLVAGRYRLRGRVGAGAMGVVWQAVDERLGRVVALKQLVVPEGADPVEAAGRAAREGRIAARLQHPNAVTVHDVVEEDGRPVLVMEYLPARTLADEVAERGALPAERVMRVGAQIAGALAAAHAAGIVHRDVKPGNILLTDDGTAKITDFGISRAIGDVTVTKTGLLAGTPAFLAPEVARGSEPGPAADVFSLGATLYAAVEGRPPFGDSDNAIALLHTVASGHYAPPTQAGPLTDVLVELLRNDPSTRPTMTQAADLLRAVRPAPTRLDLHPAGTLTVPPPAPQAGPASGPPFSAAPFSPGPSGHAPASGAPLGPRPGQTSGRRGVIALVAVAVAALVVFGVVLATRGSDTAGGTTPTTTVTPAVPTTVAPERLEQVVAEYYGLLPENPAGAWELLGPQLQAQGEQQYEKSWSDVKDLTISSPPAAAGPDAVTVGIDFTGAEGKRFRESHRLVLVVRDGTPLIDSDEVVSSQRIGDDKGKDDEDEDDEDKKDDKKRGGGNGNG
ncbi:serine/threonine-protein kinase [Saccharothrix isguenensis]